MGIGEHLHFDVARAGDIFLDQHAIIIEGGFGFAFGAFECGFEIARRLDLAHAFAAAARNRLDENGVADLACFRRQMLCRLIVAQIAGHHRHARLLHQGLGAILQAHGADRRWRRPDEHDFGGGAGFGEFGILRKKAIAGVDGFRAGLLRGGNHGFDIEIAFARGGRADAHGFIGHRNVQSARIRIGINRDGAYPQALRGAHYAGGDFAAIGDEE